MGRGINSGLIQIRPERARDMAARQMRPGSNDTRNTTLKWAYLSAAVYAGESPLRRRSGLRVARDADDQDTKLGGRKRRKKQTLYI
jgi:hypothetical protein